MLLGCSAARLLHTAVTWDSLTECQRGVAAAVLWPLHGVSADVQPLAPKFPLRWLQIQKQLVSFDEVYKASSV